MSIMKHMMQPKKLIKLLPNQVRLTRIYEKVAVYEKKELHAEKHANPECEINDIGDKETENPPSDSICKSFKMEIC